MKILPSATEGDLEGQRAEPMKVFDNLYFVGQKAVTTWALTTSEGIVLIDAGYPDRFDDTLVTGLMKVGLDPRRIRAALIAHEHADHFGGARLLQERFKTTIYMSRAAWDALEPKPGAPPAAGADAPPRRGMVMTDGQPLMFGDTTILPVAIPGHTAGSMGFIFPVKDGSRTHMAALFGGSILNPQRRFPASLFQEYLTSIQHFADATQATAGGRRAAEPSDHGRPVRAAREAEGPETRRPAPAGRRGGVLPAVSRRHGRLHTGAARAQVRLKGSE